MDLPASAFGSQVGKPTSAVISLPDAGPAGRQSGEGKQRAGFVGRELKPNVVLVTSREHRRHVAVAGGTYTILVTSEESGGRYRLIDMHRWAAIRY